MNPKGRYWVYSSEFVDEETNVKQYNTTQLLNKMWVSVNDLAINKKRNMYHRVNVGDVIRFGKVVVRIKEINNSNEISRYNSHLEDTKREHEYEEAPPIVLEDSKGEQEYIGPSSLIDEENKGDTTGRTFSSRADTIMEDIAERGNTGLP